MQTIDNCQWRRPCQTGCAPSDLLCHCRHERHCEDILCCLPFIITLLLSQMATALLVAGPTLTLWKPGQTLFASTRSYSSLVQRLPV